MASTSSSADVSSSEVLSILNSNDKSKGVTTPNSKVTASSLDHRMTVEKDIVDELLLVCGVIGTSNNEGNELIPVTDCLNWLQDLQRALRRDEDLYRPISLLIGKWKVVEQKLFPLVMTCRYDTSIVLTVVKILVILTKPLAENTKRAGRMIIDSSKKSNAAVVQEQIKMRENAVEQAEQLIEYKRGVANHSSHHLQKGGTGLLSVFVSLLAEPLSKSGAARSDADHLTIELVLHLFRNLLSAEPLLNTSSDTARDSNQLHQHFISLFEKELVLDIIMVLGQEMELRENAQYNLLMMELLHHLLKSQDPTAVARSISPTKEKSYKSSTLLAAKMKQEQDHRRAFAGVRHGNFGGTWMTQQRDGKRSYVGATQSQQPTQRWTMAKRKNRKAEPFIGCRRSHLAHSKEAPQYDGPATRRANQSLHNFCQRFVKDCYGPVMKSLKNEFRRDSVRLEDGDKIVFFRIVWFFCQWWRLSRTDRTLGQLIFTMDVFTFNLVMNSTDIFHQQKKYARLAQTVALYSEMTHLLADMYISNDKTENIMAMGLMDRLFYGSDPLDRLPKLLSRWTAGTTAREYLCDLVELCHVSLKLLDANAKKCRQGLQSKQKKTNDKIEKMMSAAADFDTKAYFCRKLVSNQLVSMYTHLLSQYKINASHVNHRVIAMFLRLSQTVIASPEALEAETPDNPLGIRPVTLEPMLYNIHLLSLTEEILNDTSIRNEKEYDSITTFSTNLAHKFWTATQANPMFYIECLFRHIAPARFCESVTNMYVSEELRMIAERELLLEEQRRYELEYVVGPEGNAMDESGGEEELEFTDAAKAMEVQNLGATISDSDEADKCPKLSEGIEEQTRMIDHSDGKFDTELDGDRGAAVGRQDGVTSSRTSSRTQIPLPRKRQRTSTSASGDVSSDEDVFFDGNRSASLPASLTRAVVDSNGDN